jgi:hypothetical protein
MADANVSDNLTTRMLASVERIGNKLPDPAMLFVYLLVFVWLLSWLLSYVSFEMIDPRSGEPLVIKNLLSGSAMTAWLSVMVTNFSHFHPVGVVLVAMLGIGVAEHTGFINTGLRALLGVTAKWLVTPMVILVGIVTHAIAVRVRGFRGVEVECIIGVVRTITIPIEFCRVEIGESIIIQIEIIRDVGIEFVAVVAGAVFVCIRSFTAVLRKSVTDIRFTIAVVVSIGIVAGQIPVNVAPLAIVCRKRVDCIRHAITITVGVSRLVNDGQRDIRTPGTAGT